MAKYKNKWEIKSWTELVASVADSSNDLMFRPKHRLPRKLQHGAKASKNANGWFNRDTITKTTDGTFDAGFYIYDSGSGLSYTGIPNADFLSSMDEYLVSASLATGSSSISAAGYLQISTSFFDNTTWPDVIMQIDEDETVAATASFTISPSIIGDLQSIFVVNSSTNCTSMVYSVDGSPRTGYAGLVEHTLPMETIAFTANYESKSIHLNYYTGSEYSPAQYDANQIYTVSGGSPTSASLLNVPIGSGSLLTGVDYSYVAHHIKMKAFGDGPDAIYDFFPTHRIMQFSSSMTSLSVSCNRYASGDILLTGPTDAVTIYMPSGTNAAPQYGTHTVSSGSHVFTDAGLIYPAPPGIYQPVSGTAGYYLPTPILPEQVSQFNGKTY